MTEQVQKIRKEVERIQLYTQSETLKQVLDYIDEVQKEPVIEELEKVAELYTLDDSIKPWRNLTKEAFKAGAKWQKSQGVTIEAVIGITPKEYFISISQSTVDMLDLCAGDKVIVQLRKKEDKI